LGVSVVLSWLAAAVLSWLASAALGSSSEKGRVAAQAQPGLT